MPEHFRRATGRPREVTDAVKNPTLDLTTLTDQEEKIIQAVIQKDEIERSILEAKISEVRKEIQEIRKAGALTAGDDQNAICARCKFKFMPFIVPWADHGQRCVTCKFRVCAKCRTQQSGGAWLCILCFKYRQEKQLTGEFMSKGPPAAAGPLYGSDLLRASLRDRSHRRSGYEQAEGVNYIQRPAKTRDVDSDTETPAASLTTVRAAEELRKEQSLKSRESSDYSSNKTTYLRQSSHIRRAAYVCSASKDPATHHLQTAASTSLADNVNSNDVTASESRHMGENVPEFSDRSADAASFDESGTRKYYSDGDQVGHRNSTSPPQQEVRVKRAFLNRIISISEQTLYYDDVKVTAQNMPRFSSLDYRSTSSLCSDYSINPKYRSLKPASGASELELFRKRGERYSMRRKRTLEQSQSEEKNDINPDTPPGSTSIDSGVNQTCSEVINTTSNNTSIDSGENQISCEVQKTISNNTSIDSRDNQISCEVQKTISNNTSIDSRDNQISSEVQKTVSNITSIDSGENRTSSEVKKTISNNTSGDSNENQAPPEVKKIPHWHEILRMQSIVEALTKQNKSPTAPSPEPLNEAPEAVEQIFSLVKPKIRKTSLVKTSSHLTPSNSKDDSSSSQESISVYVASYMSPTKTMSADQLFTSTPKTKCNSAYLPESKSYNHQISPVPEENATTPPNEIKHTDLNQSQNVQPKLDFSRTHKSKWSYFSIRQSRNGSKHQDWRGKRKLPTLDRVTSLKRENSSQVKWPPLRRQDSYSQAIETENIPFSPPKGNTDRRGQWGKDASSHSPHANADTDLVEFKQKLDSDTSSVASFASGSQRASRTNSVGSSEGSRGMHDANSVHERNVQTIVVRGNIPAALPSKFRFRRSSSSFTESQRSDSFDSSSSYEQSNVVGSNNKSPAVSRSSADEESGVKKAWSGGGDGVAKAYSKEDNSETVNSSEENIKSRPESQDSFEEVYNSNANLFVQMMNNEESAKVAESTKDKVGRQRRRLPQRPGEGKNLHILLQKSVSLSEEMAENARFQSFDEGDKEVLLAVTGKTAKDRSDDILEEKLLLPSEIRKRQSSKDSFTSKDSSGPQKQTSRIPIIKTPSYLEKEKLRSGSAQMRIVPDMMKEKALPKASFRFGTQVAEAGSANMTEPSEVDHRSWLKKPHQLEVKQPPGVTRIFQGRPEDHAVNLSRSGSNVSDARSNVTEDSDLHGKAEKYDYGSSDDTFQNSSLDSSFSDDDIPNGQASVDFVQAHKVMHAEMDHSLNRKSISHDDGSSKATDDHDAFQRTRYEEDHDEKSDDSQMCTDRSGDRASLMSSATEDSNPEGYYQGRGSSINYHTSDLDPEDLLHSALSRDSTESYRDAHPGKNDQPSVSILRESLEGVGNNIIGSERGGLDEEYSEFLYNKVTVEEVSSIKDQSLVSSVLGAKVECATKEQDGLVLLTLKHPERLIPGPTDHSFDSYLPDATMDLDCPSNHHLVEKINNSVTYHLKQGPGHQVSDSPKVADGDAAGGQRRIERRDVTLASSTDRLSVPSIAVTNTGVERNKDDEDEEDDFDELFNNHQPNTLLGSRSSLADSRESIYSVYSDAGEVNYGRISVTGEIMFKLNYNHKNSTLEVHIIQCKDLAPVDTKHNRSDPYVKTYLLPDKTRSSKRKTRIKKHTLSPIFDEILKYQLSMTELESRSLWVTVWHNDRFGRNDFLGEVTIPLDYYSYNENAPQWYPLQERTPTQDPMMSYRGDLFISLKFVTPDMVDGSPKKKSGTLRKKTKEKEKPLSGLGEIHVLVKEAQNLTAMRGSAGSDPFCKGYLLPDESHGSKQKTPVVRKTTNPQWQHILVFEGVDQCRLPQHGLELTIWDFERLSSNDFLGGVRLNLGQGCNQGKSADWMDARGEEIEAWQSMIDHPNEWVDVQLPLRISMSKESTKK